MGPPGAACHSPNEIPPECVVTLAGFREPSCTGSGAIVGAPLRKRRNARAVPYEHPAGMRIWKCRITAASVLGIEIASATPAAVFFSSYGTLFANIETR
jgi:hypothetical protein